MAASSVAAHDRPLLQNRRKRRWYRSSPASDVAGPQAIRPFSFTKILQCDLDSLVVHLLEVVAVLLSALGTAREELDDVSNWRVALDRFDPGSRPYIDEAVEIVIDHVVEQGVDIDPARRFIADAQHLGTIAYRRDGLIAPKAGPPPKTNRGLDPPIRAHTPPVCASLA